MAGSIELSIRLFSETEPAVARLFTESGERTARRDGVLFLRAGGQVYSCKDSPEARKLFEAFCGREEGKMDSGSETQLLRDVLVGLTDAACLRRFGIAGKSTRCVAVFRSARQEARLLKEIIPMEKADHLTMMENGDLALVLQTEERSTEEVYEFVAAAAGTMESEAGIGCWAGIGRNVEEAEKLPESYRMAMKALETGLRHKAAGKVFAYDKLVLERLADMIPEEDAAMLRGEILSPETDKLLTPEILETIQVFFRNDLNLSTTARQLYLHRNTLMYRLEKVRRETGLDLRKFEDAAIFRMMMSLSEKQE